MTRMLGGPVPNNSKALIALASVSKSFVDDLVAAGGALLGCSRAVVTESGSSELADGRLLGASAQAGRIEAGSIGISLAFAQQLRSPLVRLCFRRRRWLRLRRCPLSFFAFAPLYALPAAMAVAEERGEGTPLQPAHIHEAYQRLIAADKVPGKAPRRRTFL